MGAARDLNESMWAAETPCENRSQADTRTALTTRQLGVLRAVEEWIASRGWPPTHREIGARVGVPSVSAVDGHLEALERKGYIARSPGEARGLRVLVPSTSARAVMAPLASCCRCRGREVR